MKFALFTAAVAISSVSASLVSRDDAPVVDDTTVLKYALTLEHLENAFYSGALAKFDEAAFEKAGYPSWVRRRFTEIASHEAAHVALLAQVLGANATSPCTYSFPYTSPKSFVALSQILEGVGSAAYTGAASSITSKAYLTAAASILATEARHASWVASAVNKQNPWSSAFETPMDFNQVYTLAAGFITSCPASNPTLPFKPFPSLTFPANTKSGSTARVAFDSSATASSSTNYIAFLDGLDTKFVPLDSSNVQVPAGLKGTVYALVVTSNELVTDSTTVAGPAILSFPF